jgi:hypothetical protein
MSLAEIARYPITIEGETIWIGTANELAIALDVLQGQRDHETLAQLRPHLAGIIAHAKGFTAVLRTLTTEDQIYLIEAIGPDLVQVMQNAAYLRDLLAVIADTRVEEALLRALGATGLRHLVVSAEELAEVLEWVYDQCDSLVLELLGLDAVRRLCRHASDLSAVLRSLDHARQKELVGQLGWAFVADLVRDGRDLAYLLRTLPPADSERLLRHYTCQQLAALIGNARDWTYLCQRLEPAEADLLFGLLGVR